MKFLETLKSLPLSRQLALAAATLGVVLAMVFLVQGAMNEPKSLLYSKLEPATAGEIIEELDQRGVEYELRGDSIFIAQSKRDQVRFALARQGLPQQSVQGYELLDDVNGFSVTSEMYNAAYWRAKEGELTRTILAIEGVSSARVHIGANLGSGFTRSQSPQTASVTLNTTHDLSPGQAEAIQYMVALAVAGLAPEDVAVIDPVKGLLAGPNVAKASQPSVVAEGQASMLEEKILRLIDARVGAGNARVSVSVDVNRQHQTISERTVDPDSRIVRSRSVNDVSETSAGSSGALSAASNLPQGEGAGGGGNSSTMRNSTESVNYDFNERRTETELLPGEIERVSVAVLLNEQALGLGAEGQDPAVAANEIIADFEQLILSGAGLNSERGDTLTVELMPFQQAAVPEMVTAPGMAETLVQNYFWSGLQALLLGLVVLGLGLGVVRPLLTQKGTANSALEGPGASHGPTVLEKEPADPFTYLSDYTRERPDETVALLQSWLNEDRKAAVNE
ncbi:flagellar basal-body MS-ring/collar protein FliF [Henriciella sp.]|uniref:flagellar basal-body MS-ring/collar protein FliF n=1 Tax=Henriciella sp. TaxID=1968823 RepID=UPI000C1073EF|nr:flagellar basal-body MS-ring/collar protein FliF [Henriciella sp.]PHR82653.1 MAG: flagellar M-ring protein FliF [Henriciella sp.]